jgi:hypothetical protein
MLWGFVDLLGGNALPSLRRGLRAGLLWLGAGLFNPLAPALAMLVSGLYAVLLLLRPRGEDRTGSIRMFAIAWLLPLPLVVYSAAASLIDPFFKAWSAQNTIHSPPPIQYLLGYAIYLPWAILGIRRLVSSGEVRDRLPVIWVLVVPLLLYLPVNLQRRLAEGVFIALLVSFVSGLDLRRTGGGEGLKRAVVIAAAAPTSLVLLAGSSLTAWSPALPAFRPAGEIAAFDFLAKEASPGSVVLAPVPAGNALPAFVPVRVVIGHGPETIGFALLKPQVEAFFAGEMSDSAAAEFLEEQGVDFVFWHEPARPVYSGLEPAYLSGEIAVYRVVP